MKKGLIILGFLLSPFFASADTTYQQVTLTVSSVDPDLVYLNIPNLGNPVGSYYLMYPYGDVGTTSANVFRWGKTGAGCTGSGCTVSYPYPISDLGSVGASNGQTWWLAIYFSAIDTVYYASSYNNAGTWLPSSPAVQSANDSYRAQYNTKFTGLDITGSSTVDFNAVYYLDTSEVNSANVLRNPTSVRFTISLRPGATTSARSIDIDNSVNGIGYATDTRSGLADGTYDILVTFSNLSSIFSGQNPFPEVYIYSDFTITGGVLTDQGENEIYSYEVVDEFQPLPCSLTNIQNCITNAFSYLFVPNDTKLQGAIGDIYAQTATRTPFAEITMAKNILVTFDDNTATTARPTLPIKMFGTTTNILGNTELALSDTTRNAMIALMQAGLWVGLLVAIWYQRNKIFA